MSEAKKLKLGVLISGSGTNLQAIIDRIAEGTLNATIELVVSSRPSAYGLKRAQAAGLQTLTLDKTIYEDPIQADMVIATELKQHNVDYVVMAGYMRMVHDPILLTFPNRVLNLHPALLPSFPGLHGQKQAVDYGVKFSGCTVHFVDAGTDSGPIILQKVVPVMDDDTEDTLADRILVQEHIAMPEALKLWAEGKLTIEGRKVKVKA